MADPLRPLPGADPAGGENRPPGPGDLAPGLLDPLPAPTSPPDAIYRTWNADAQQRALDRLRTETAHQRVYKPFYCGRPDCDGNPHDQWTWQHARALQVPPPLDTDWLVWLLLGGRGSGKTRAGAEFTHRMTQVCPRIALIGPTGPDIREIMVEGVSGLQATANPKNPVGWEPSKRKLTWANGAIGTTFSAEEPDRLRGPQHYLAWADEPAHMPFINQVWDNLLFGLRLGGYPRIVATTTPKPTPWMKGLVADPLTIAYRFSTYANLANLAEPFQRTVLDRYEGTRLGRQELHGEILEDVEGALWTWDLLEPHRRDAAPDLDRIVVGIDPAGTARAKSDETGIIVVGICDREVYVLADGSGRMTPNRWASTALNLLEHWGADALIPEKNYGGDMVTSTLRSVDSTARIIPVTSRRGKQLRAEPVVSLYEQGRVHHVGNFPELETQMTEWVPGHGDSPDRVDALVHAITALAKPGVGQSQVASPTGLRLVTNSWQESA